MVGRIPESSPLSTRSCLGRLEMSVGLPKRDVRPDVLDQIVAGHDLLGKPVELASCVHASGTHVVETRPPG